MTTNSEATDGFIPNGGAAALGAVPGGSIHDLRNFVMERVAGGSRLAALFPYRRNDATHLLAVTASQNSERLRFFTAPVGDAYPALTPECLSAHAFEREIAEQWGITPQGHPWLKPLRFQPKKAAGGGSAGTGAAGDAAPRKPLPGVMEYFRVQGEDVHEVAVGPVHAGVIEPGHFRFQCHGEKVLFLEISLGYQHRGVEKALLGGPDRRTRHLVETAAGDTSIGHATAYAGVVEALSGIAPDSTATIVRAILLELERLANHVGDLGALSGDVGFLPTASFCGRLRGDILNLTAQVVGNRFGRGMVVPGGVSQPLPSAMAADMLTKLLPIERDVMGAVDLLFNSASVLARFEGTGVLSRATADHLGVVGPTARASGIAEDVRLGLPREPYSRGLFELDLGRNGDVMDRAKQRHREIRVSFRLVRQWLGQIRDSGNGHESGRGGGVSTPSAPALPLAADAVAATLVEGWRGRICHVAITDAAGVFLAYKLVDPSFHNWMGLAMAMRDQHISDFPLCNKSFNLSYCGHDL